MEKIPGTKAMKAVARKFITMMWGWYHAATAFNIARVLQPRFTEPSGS
jgi:hypothetical protein